MIVIDCEEEFESDELKHDQMINLIKSKLDLIFNKNKIELEFESDIKKISNKLVLENI